MRKFKIIGCVMLWCILMAGSPLNICKIEAANDTLEESSSQETQLSDEDWKIVIDEKKNANEFGFIQRNLESSDLVDNGQFLLVAGIVLLVLSGVGIVFFSRRLYKLLKSSATKRKPKRTGARYK